MRDLNERERDALKAARGVACDILAGIRGAVILALPYLMRLGCVAAAMYGAVWSWPLIYAAFGGDIAALLPTLSFMLLPVAAVVAAGLSWGGLLIAGAACAVMGIILPRLGAVMLSLLAVAPIAVAVFHTLTHKE